MVVVCSCDDDSSAIQFPSNPEANYKGIIMDSERLGTVFCYPMNEGELSLLKQHDSYFDDAFREQHKEEYNQYVDEYGIDAPMQYGNMRLLFYVRHASVVFEEYFHYTKEEELKRLKEFALFKQNVSLELLPTEEERETVEEKLEGMHYVGKFSGLCPIFFAARMRGGATVTADKVLFGQQVGEDLSSHFAVEAPSLLLPKGSLTDYTIQYGYTDKERESSVAGYFVEDTWVQKDYALHLKDIPEEMYDEVTFTITIPIICDYWHEYYLSGKDEVEHSDRDLSISCTVSFNQSSNFTSRYAQYKAENDQLGW